MLIISRIYILQKILIGKNRRNIRLYFFLLRTILNFIAIQ